VTDEIDASSVLLGAAHVEKPSINDRFGAFHLGFDWALGVPHACTVDR
jgi:hypothetical protein